jgi:hypothetical protein
MARLYKRPDRGNTYWYDFIDPRTGRRRRVNTGCTSKAEAEAFVQDLWARLKGLVQGYRNGVPVPGGSGLSGRQVPDDAVGGGMRSPSKTSWPSWGTYPFRPSRPAMATCSAASGPPPAGGSHACHGESGMDGPIEPAVLGRRAGPGSMRTPPSGSTPETPAQGRDFRPDEIRRLLETPTTPHMRMAFLLALTTGLRRGELLRLRREDVLLDAGLIAHPERQVGPGPLRPRPGPRPGRTPSVHGRLPTRPLRLPLAGDGTTVRKADRFSNGLAGLAPAGRTPTPSLP